MFPNARLVPYFKTALLLFSIGFAPGVIAKEGMWIPSLLKSREADMKKAGLEIPVDMLYNEAGTGLNNAVVLFGTGCTAEIISSNGLLLTNHHCGYGTVQGLSNKEHDYFANGFFAHSSKEELPCPGLKVTFVRRMENVTDKILTGLEDTLSGQARDSIIATRIRSLENGYKYTTKMDAVIKPYYNGNQYWVAITETFKDVRLVGFPPNGIGAFGGDTDNWMWPRHTGDFSMFRIYAGKNNQPADYSKDNKPYKAKQFFTLNVSGYKEGDFTMVYGFPAVSMEYLSSFQLDHIYSIIDPVRIEARTKRINIWTENMNRDREVFLKYTSKKAGIANGWKKWQGEVHGLQVNDVISKKRTYEQNFQGWAQADNTLPYADDLLSQIGARSLAMNNLIKADEYIKEDVLGIELIQQGAVLDNMLHAFRTGKQGNALSDTLQRIYKASEAFYKNYDVATDKQVFMALMPLFFEKNNGYIPVEFSKQFAEQGSDYRQWADYVYSSAGISAASLNRIVSSMRSADSMQIFADPAWQLYNAVTIMRKQRIIPALSNYYEQMKDLNREYMKAQMKLDKLKDFYPDANQTLRLTYGKVEGVDPSGPAPYSFQTNLDQAIAKDNPEVEEFKVPQKLKDLYAKKNYGQWNVNGTVPIAFTASNHTSGGNSGSPVLNSKGQLIGTNFDRVWDGTMSDLYFDPELCRNISLDIRYTLFIVEKFGNAGWLLKEMKIVKK
jgi:hypothetical protein